MLSDNDHSGVLMVLVGIIALVFTGVGLSIFKDKHLGTSGNAALAREINEDRDELARMKENLDSQARHYDRLQKRSAESAEIMDRVKPKLAEQAGLLETLPATRDELRREVPKLEREFSDYRQTCRQQARDAAAGLSLAAIKTKDGRLFLQVKIRQVTASGIEIDHSEGTIRIPATDLEQPYHERFQWTDAELKAAASIVQSKPAGSSPGPPPAKPAAPAPASALDRERITRAQTVVRSHLTRMNAVATQLAEARRAIASGRKSVPGSLETWQARADRAAALLGSLRREFDLAKADLAAMAPGDPLTQAVPPQ